jgi:nucleotide-binding universal stress UspA family protein
MWKTLLVPHDFSPCADRALALAGDLARQHGASVVLVHITHLPPGLMADAMMSDRETGQLVRVDAYARATATARLEEVAGPYRAAGLEISVRAVVGDVADEILELVAEVGADLIVMGTHGRTGLRHMLLGSMAEKVVRQATVPVLTVREPDSE